MIAAIEKVSMCIYSSDGLHTDKHKVNHLKEPARYLPAENLPPVVFVCAV